MVRLKAAHQRIRSAKRRRVNGWDASVKHQELLREGQLVADALVDVVSCCNHAILVGVGVQAVEEGAERWRI
eukprot:5820493-Pleurochrysis_carterae.AAC.1